MLTLARLANGLSQSQLAKNIGVTQGKVSKLEDGLLVGIADSDLSKISETLHVPKNFFYQRRRANAKFASFYRKRNSIPMRILNTCDAKMNITRIQLEQLMASTDLDVPPIPHYKPDEFSDGAAGVARMLRQFWGIPKGPIKNLTEAVENAGILVIHMDFGTPKLDGITMWSEENFPIIFLNALFPPSRMRLTLSHELGHVVMHRMPTPGMEDEAWEFASEFLAPAKECKHSFFPLNLSKLLSLKTYWGISMQALLMHGQRLGCISDRYARSLWMQISKAGYKKNEPNEEFIPVERPSLARELVQMHLDELDYSISELAESLSVFEEDLVSTYVDDTPKFKII